MRPRKMAVWILAGVLALAWRWCRRDDDTLTLATFNIEMFPHARTDRARVVDAIVQLDATVIAVQEIRDPFALFAVAWLASRASGRDYAVTLASCGGNGSVITNGLIYDRARVRLVERREIPALGSDHDGCEVGVQPALLGVFADRDDRRFGVISLHMHPYAGQFEKRKTQWHRLIAFIDATKADLQIPILAMGDYNTTGFRGDPADERAFVEEIVAAAGFALPTAGLQCTEYWKPKDRQVLEPSVLDHVVVTEGEWSARALGMCERLACRRVHPRDVDPDYHHVSDHCPVRIVGSPW